MAEGYPELRPRSPDYSEKKRYIQITITPTARGSLQGYADELGTSISEVIEQMARNPTFYKGYVAYLRLNKISD